MFDIVENITRHANRQVKTYSEERIASEPDISMADFGNTKPGM